MKSDATPPGIGILEGTVLGGLSDDLRQVLLVEGRFVHAQKGDQVVGATASGARVGLILDGSARAYLRATDGRQLTIHHLKNGSLVGGMASRTTNRATLRTEAATDCTVIEFGVATLFQLIEADPAVAIATVTEISRLLEESYAALASNAFDSMRERIARELLRRAAAAPRNRSPVVATTQQQLADSVGTVREVVARVLQGFRQEGLVRTGAGEVEIRDPAGLAAIVGRWQRQ